MNRFTQLFALSAAALALGTGAASAQPTAQTPLTEPVQVSGSVDPSVSSSCGLRGAVAVQTLQVGQDFAAVEVAVRNGTNGLTLLIEGNNGFSECHTSSNGTISAPGLLNRGTYSFYIGNTNPTATNFNLTIR
jgi:hypothetical protein